VRADDVTPREAVCFTFFAVRQFSLPLYDVAAKMSARCREDKSAQ